MMDLLKPEIIFTHESDLDGLLSGVLLQRLVKKLFNAGVRIEAYHYNYWRQRELRESIAWVAGLAGMSWPRFLFWNALGGIAWATGVGLLAYLGGKALADAVSRYGLYAGAVIVLAVVLIVGGPRVTARLLRGNRSKRERKERPAS